MSGPICPDCNFYDFEEVSTLTGKKIRCTFCGWEGGPLPRKILSSGMLNDFAKDHNIRRKLKEEGKLFFLRVYVTDDEDRQDDMLFEIMEMCNLTSMSGARGNPPYFFIEFHEQKPEEMVRKVKSIKGVKKVKKF